MCACWLSLKTVTGAPGGGEAGTWWGTGAGTWWGEGEGFCIGVVCVGGWVSGGGVEEEVWV